jgi:AcrR family transcriptional regulator
VARTGRRPGKRSTRELILEVARRRFAAGGYAATSVRAIAAEAGVDPAAVLHFFGSKAGLFAAAVGWPFDPARAERELAAAASGGLGAALARTFFSFWDDPEIGASLRAVMRSAMTHAESAVLLREFVLRQIFVRVAVRVAGPDRELRIELAAGQLVGVALLRYVLAVEPIASASPDQLVEWLSPALDRYLEARDSPSSARSGPAARDG